MKIDIAALNILAKTMHLDIEYGKCIFNKNEAWYITQYLDWLLLKEKLNRVQNWTYYWNFTNFTNAYLEITSNKNKYIDNKIPKLIIFLENIVYCRY